MVSLFSVNAENNDEHKFSEEEEQEFMIRIKQKLTDFQTHIGVICSKKSSKKTLDTAVNKCLKLFIGEGETYYTIDAYGNRIENAPVTIHITSEKVRRVRTNTVKRYLNSLANNLNKMYTKVNISSFDVVRFDNIHKTEDGRYVGVAYFFQKFGGYRDGRLVYTDTTKKKVLVYINPITGPVGEITWTVALGDISVVETRQQ